MGKIKTKYSKLRLVTNTNPNNCNECAMRPLGKASCYAWLLGVRCAGGNAVYGAAIPDFRNIIGRLDKAYVHECVVLRGRDEHRWDLEKWVR